MVLQHWTSLLIPRTSLLHPPEFGAGYYAASPTSPFASELSTPRQSLPVGGTPAAVAMGGAGQGGLGGAGPGGLGGPETVFTRQYLNRRMSDSR